MITTKLIFFIVCATLAVATDYSLDDYDYSVSLFSSDIYMETMENNITAGISPFAIAEMLELIWMATEGETADQIRDALYINKTKEDLRSTVKLVFPILTSSSKITVNLANKIYITKKLTVKSDFEAMANDFHVEIESVDFEPYKIDEAVNEWLSKKTDNTITNMQVTTERNHYKIGNDSIVLISSLYFKSTWANKFPVKDTQPRPFTTSMEEIIQVDTMFRNVKANFHVSFDLKAKFLELPLEEEDTSVVFILPNTFNGIEELQQNMEAVLAPVEMKKRDVDVYLPKFTIESQTDFKIPLWMLDMRQLIQYYNGDFSGIAEKDDDIDDLGVSEVKQKVYLDVDENGASVEDDNKDASRVVNPCSVVFNAGHPFLFYVRVKGLIIFIGKVVNPK